MRLPEQFEFDTETAIHGDGPERWRTYLSGAWNIGQNPNGGYLLAPLQRAMVAASGQPDPLTVTTHYLRPGSPDQPGEIEVELVRSGRTLSTVRGRLIQGGTTRLESIAAFTDLGNGDTIAALTTPVAPVPPPDQCISRASLAQGVDLAILNRLDVRVHPDHAVADPSGLAEVTGWIRFRDGRPVDAHALTLFADAFPPSLFSKLGRIGWVPTIELTVQVRRRPVQGWIRGHFSTTDATGNRVIEDGWLWDETGALVAVSRQVGLILTP